MHLPEIHLYRPRAHREPRGSDYVGENQGAWISIRGYTELQHVLHVHTTGLTLEEAQKTVNEIKPAYQAVGLYSCIPTKDTDGNREVLFLLHRNPGKPVSPLDTQKTGD